ncbi:MAG: hypothetical protein LBJ20_06565 [Candidatus Methanoplasma sp.]|jgi:hypothetical protein|nr:hypothetical protein [Candidatus Methanoplasma sp.]
MDYHEAIKNGKGERLVLKVAKDMKRHDVTAKVVRSREVKELQAADMVASSVGQEYNKGKSQYLDAIRPKVTVRKIKPKK